MTIKRIRPTRTKDERDTVLVTDGGTGQGRSALAAVRALGAGGYRAVVGVTGPRNMAATSRFCSSSVLTPLASDPGYADSVRASADSLRARLVLASDAALVALDRPEAVLVDKASLEQRCSPVEGLTVPPSSVVSDSAGLLDAASLYGYPLVVKPTVSTRPPLIVQNETQAAAASATVSSADPAVVQPFLDGPLEAVSGVMHQGRLVAAVHQCALRTWPVSSGPSCAAVTVDRNPERERQLEALLVDHEGIFQAQFLGAHLIDLNPRVYGSLPLAVAAGVNLLAIALDPPAANVPTLVAKPGVHYRWLEGDLRHAFSMRSTLGPKSLLSALRPRAGTAHSVVSLSDPRPFASRLRYARSRR